jgi:hypothetical protein
LDLAVGFMNLFSTTFPVSVLGIHTCFLRLVKFSRYLMLTKSEFGCIYGCNYSVPGCPVIEISSFLWTQQSRCLSPEYKYILHSWNVVFFIILNDGQSKDLFKKWNILLCLQLIMNLHWFKWLPWIQTGGLRSGIPIVFKSNFRGIQF